MLDRARPGPAKLAVVSDAFDVAAAAVSACLEQARALPFTQAAVAELGAGLEPALAVAALERARRELDEHAVTVLLGALAAAGKLPASASYVPALPLVAGMDQFLGLLVASPDDPTDALLDLLDAGTLSEQRECVGLFFLAERHHRCRKGENADPRLCRLLRQRMRDLRLADEGLLLAQAVGKLADPGVQQVAQQVGLPRPSPAFEQRLLGMFHADWRQFVPQREPPRALPGTARRVLPKVQRNDPCPCGSGRKFKKCCAGKEGQYEAIATPPSVQAWDVGEMRPAEIARLDPAALDRDSLIMSFRVALRYHEWELAERLMAALDPRFEDDEPADTLRLHFCERAVTAGAAGVVARVVASARRPQELRRKVGVVLGLLRPDAETVAHLEAKAAAGLRGDIESVYELAYGLLDHSPALGILVARGSLDPARAFDSMQLLDDIERARDALLLPPGDPAARTLDRLVADHADEAARRAEGAAIDSLARSLQEKQRTLEATQREAAALQRRIEEATSHIAALERRDAAAVPAPAGGAPAPGAVAPELERELLRLRGRVGELKGLVTENMQRRKMLERQLEAQQGRPDPPAPSRPGPEPVEAEDVLAAESLAPRAVCVPVFDDAAAAALRALDRSISARILRAIGLVAAADPGAWREVKVLRAAPGTLRLRVGQYRVLFHEDSERRVLTVRQIVARTDLDEAVRRLS